jgi:ketosteroid isomerase-like protein
MDLDAVIAKYHRAADEFSRGRPDGVKALYSHREDVALANPFGPPASGWEKVSEALDFASSRFRDGEVTDFERIALYSGSDLAVLLELEAWQAKVAGSDELSPFLLRVTTTFRLEGGDWKMVHRHADPIATFDAQGPLRGT